MLRHFRRNVFWEICYFFNLMKSVQWKQWFTRMTSTPSKTFWMNTNLISSVCLVSEWHVQHVSRNVICFICLLVDNADLLHWEFSAIISCRWKFEKVQCCSHIKVISIKGKPVANPAKLCSSGLLFFSGPASHPVIQPASQPRVPLVPLKNHEKRMFSALFCPDYIRCGGNGGTLGGCQPCWALGRRE